MLAVENRINSKEDLREWITYERKKYGGGGTARNNPDIGS